MTTTTVNADPLALLGRATAGLTSGSLPTEVVYRAKQRVLDTLGCLVAGYDAGIAREIADFALSQAAAAEATLLPHGQKTTVSLACLAHATYIHGLELSDAAPRGTVHPGNEVVPAALAMAEKRGADGAAVIAAVAAGYEVEIRVGRALFPNAFYRGWWTPGLFGGLGSAVAAGHLLGLDAKGLDNAIGIVLNLLPTASMRANEEGETIKWLIGGQSCASGVLAAEMAARGVKGMRDVVGGWLPIIADGALPERLTEGIRPDGRFEQWELLSGVVTKHYATVGPLTATLDATFDLVIKNDIAPGDIADIHVDCMRRTAIFNTRHPENDVAARASLPYCVAVAVCRKDPSLLLGPAFRDELLRDAAIRAAADKVRITQNEDYERQYPARSLARVTITLKDGTAYTQEDDRSARGRYLTPTDEDIERKFRMITETVLGKAKTERVIALVRDLDSVPDMHELVEALKP